MSNTMSTVNSITTDDFYKNFMDMLSPIWGRKHLKETVDKSYEDPANPRCEYEYSYGIKDPNGSVVGEVLELSYVPFKKTEVSVKISEREGDKILTVQIGDSGKKGSRTLEYSLGDRTNADAVVAKADDGVLKITVPYNKKEEISRTIPLD